MGSENDVIRSILVSVFTNCTIPSDCSMLGIGDLDEWDSLGNFNFLLAVEERYDLRFDIEEMAELKSVQDVVSYLEAKEF